MAESILKSSNISNISSNIIEFRSPDYNYNFDPDKGIMRRWGSSENDEAPRSPIGPEVLDIEVCKVDNNGKKHKMSLETFQDIINATLGNLRVIHFSVDKIDDNFYLPQMMRYCIENNIVCGLSVKPPIMGVYLYDIATYCTYVDVLLGDNNDKDECFNTISSLIKVGIPYVNIRLMVSTGTYLRCFSVISNINLDARLRNLNAVKLDNLVKINEKVISDTPISGDNLKSLLRSIKSKHVGLGVSPCLINKVIKLCQDDQEWLVNTLLDQEQCEAGLFKGFVNTEGLFWACPYMEFEVAGIKIDEKFLDNTWNGDYISEWRDTLVRNNRECPVFLL